MISAESEVQGWTDPHSSLVMLWREESLICVQAHKQQCVQVELS